MAIEPDPQASNETSSDQGDSELVFEPQARDGETTSVEETSLVQVSKGHLSTLKHLQDRRRTVSELAREMDMNKSTVHGYLQDLVSDDLVERQEDEERIWVYYDLTERAQALLRRRRLTLVVDLSTLFGFIGMASLGLYRFLFPPAPASSSGDMGIASPTPAPPEATGVPVLLIIYVGLALLAIGGLGLSIHLHRRLPRRLA